LKGIEMLGVQILLWFFAGIQSFQFMKSYSEGDAFEAGVFFIMMVWFGYSAYFVTFGI
jgi:hypothetical protein